jgi:DNA primase
MNNQPITLEMAKSYHEALPERVRQYLNGRGIHDEILELHLIGWDGQRITIPIHNREGQLSYLKLAKDPEDLTGSPKMLVPPGAGTELYGWERLRATPERIIICEGEFDRLVLEGRGFAAVTSTGGAGVFRPEWADAFREIPEVYVCFDRDEAGRRGAERVARLIPQAKVVDLPIEVGVGGDITDYFARLRKTREDFLQLVAQAHTVPPEPPRDLPVQSNSTPEQRTEVRELKARVRIEAVIGQYVELESAGQALRGRCPFHEDRVPSLVVYPVGQSFYCFGCGEHGDVLTFLMNAEKVGFRDALELLRQRVTDMPRAA